MHNAHSKMTPDEQIDDWIQLGMQIPERKDALYFLRHIGAAILNEYALPLRDSAGGQFPPGTAFADIVNIFKFDRQLRMVVLDAALRVEMSVRAQMELQGALPEASIRDKKSSFGKLSRRYGELPFAARQQTAGAYGMDAKVLQSFLRHLTVVRNACAHNDRLWNYSFEVRSILPTKKPALKPFFNYEAQGKLYNSLVILVYLTDMISPAQDWRRSLLALLQSREDLLAAMGFPPDWRTLKFWA